VTPASSRPALHTSICELFGVEYPIVQTGMGWVAGARLTSATSAAGGLGILASATMTLPELRTAIGEVKDRTDKNFGVNLRTDQPDIGERIDLLIREQVKVASFAQAPSRDIVAKLKDAGIVTMPTVGARRHAERWPSGVDAVIAQERRRRPHRQRADLAAAAPGGGRGRHPSARRRRLPTAVGWSPLAWGRAASPWAPGSC
jgi:hypothetical protein